ncbi:Predicted exporter [Syntrophus gentianae]|uniref:Predicted exporter n=1 Tax=Syntrophus gentianae TaxID=43775 RepID=A0A1H7YB83_9BACT|nr:methyltransferase domain-containing protein [Syntrophus gentianae]SEM43486.1 Predicted exporter [Syntrophus gentianae]
MRKISRFLKRYPVRWPLLFLVVALLLGVLVYETFFLKVETDILKSLPTHDPVLADARAVIRHLPFQDRVVIDVTSSGENREVLVEGAAFIEKRLKESGLFKEVGLGPMSSLFPELSGYVVDSLPVLFDQETLRKEVLPLLEPGRIRETLTESMERLQGLEGIGQAVLIARDPLGLRNLILAKLAHLAPSTKADLYHGQLIAPDGRHVLLLAQLAGSATSTEFTRAIPPLLERIQGDLNARFASSGTAFTLTPVGAYRAALDNESIAKGDTRKAIWLTVFGISLLLVLSFPRPLIGLLALVPSTVGAVGSLLVCSFFFDSLSLLAVGFGGAILAFTVDLGIAYLLFLDRPCETYGKRAAREVRSAEILAVLTTVGGFLLLLLSDFQILAQIGLFSAVGVFIALLFVAFIFPRLFPVMPPAGRGGHPGLIRAVDGAALSGGMWKAGLALIFAGAMAFLARPEYRIDLQAMNSMTSETHKAEKAVQATWGDMSRKVYLLLEGKTGEDLQKQSDRLSDVLAEEVRAGRLSSAFLPSTLFPGEILRSRNLEAWRTFWSRERVDALRAELGRAGQELGFASDAFAPFLKRLNEAPAGPGPIPDKYYPLLGFVPVSENGSRWVQVSPATPGPGYDAAFLAEQCRKAANVRIFDAGLFNDRLGAILASLFQEIAWIAGIGIVLVVFFFFLDWRLSLMVLAPVAFALVSTLGTLKLIGHPLDIPGIMLWVVILGMGIDYGIYYVCSYQRYRDERHPFMSLIRLAIFLSAATTLVGFGVLALADHVVLKSIGLVSLLGIGYSLIGTFTILPPLTRRFIVPPRRDRETVAAGSRRHLQRTVRRYRFLETYARMFARFKILCDPMFPRLAGLVSSPERIVDIGTGYGVPAAWLLELYPEARVYGLDPDEERVRVASWAIGDRGTAETGRAPDLPHLPEPPDTALMLDMIHLLSDGDLKLTLQRLFASLKPGGRLIVRVTVPSEKAPPWERMIEDRIRLRFQGLKPWYRSIEEMRRHLAEAGFAVLLQEPTAPGREGIWFVAEKESG